MKVFLFNSLNIIPAKYFLYPEQAHYPFMRVPPLGLFSLCGSIKGFKECESQIIDLNYEASSIQYPSETFLDELYQSIGEKFFSQIGRDEKFLAGFQTLCNSHHFAILLSRRIKNDFPKSVILFGGPHASIVAGETMELFSHVDMVLCGEADFSFPVLVSNVLQDKNMEYVEGLYYKPQEGQVRFTKAPEIPLNLDLLPLPEYKGYHYPVEMSYIEIGRGCPYRCAYCSTSIFFNRVCRYKSFKRLVKELEILKDNKTGKLENVIFVHDNFFGDKKVSLTLCRDLRTCVEKMEFQWSCSTRLDGFRDPGVMAHLKDAGCRKVFIGIETGSEDMQRRIHKNTDIRDAHSVIERLHSNNFKLICSFMCEFPDERPDELESTLRLCAFCKLHNIQFQLNPLIVLPETEMYSKYGKGLQFGPERENSEYDVGHFVSSEIRNMLEQSPKIFSVFYSHPLEYPELKGISNLAEFLINFFTYTCLGIVFWSEEPMTIVRICLALEQHWGSDRRSFIGNLAGWVHGNYGHVGPIMEVFRFERDCWDVLFEENCIIPEEKVKYPGETAGNAFSHIRVSPGSQIKWGNYRIRLRNIEQDFINALKTGGKPAIKKDEKESFFIIQGETDRDKGHCKVNISEYLETVGRLFRGLLEEKNTIGSALEASNREMPLYEGIKWILQFFEKGYVNIRH